YHTVAYPLNRVVRAAMALVHLQGLAACRKGKQLVTKADAEDRHVLVKQGLDGRHGVIRRCGRIARTVRQENAGRVHRQDVVCRSLCRNHSDACTSLYEVTEDAVLAAKV